MDTVVIILVVLLLIGLLVLGAVWLYGTNRRRQTMRRDFGPEYDRTVAETGSRRDAEAELMRRRERVEKLQLKELPHERRTQFQIEWRGVQARFVDDPRGAVQGADMLIGQVMWERGYPASDFEEMANDASVQHPEAVYRYREAHALAVKDKAGGATTEELRRAFQGFRALFDEMLGRDGGGDGQREQRPMSPDDQPQRTGAPENRRH